MLASFMSPMMGKIILITLIAILALFAISWSLDMHLPTLLSLCWISDNNVSPRVTYEICRWISQLDAHLLYVFTHFYGIFWHEVHTMLVDPPQWFFSLYFPLSLSLSHSLSSFFSLPCSSSSSLPFLLLFPYFYCFCFYFYYSLMEVFIM